MTKPALRCAIYTRVSSDQGLEQDFNSLDAQREAAEAYIKSQAHEGWRLIRDHYDDGGYSGGTMERPALQRLLEVIGAGRIDIVVVYKVDRLTRSLADFAKLVELFDAHEVSFVSVTQSFNTTTSMGRLTLNVLLSFAQFEREVTGERIRDKIAASKKKGMWMGGVVPLGYRVEARKLVVEEEEAKLVRKIFERYVALGSIPALQRELRSEGVVTRERRLANGKIVGAVALTNGPLSYILKNRHYLGELNHHGRSWPAEHERIIDSTLFDAVQAKLADNLNRAVNRKAKSGALLMGKIFDDRGNPMSPSHAVKKGVRYRYYVSSPIAQGRKEQVGSVARVPAEPIEEQVLAELRRTSGDQTPPTLLIAISLSRSSIASSSARIISRCAARTRRRMVRRMSLSLIGKSRHRPAGGTSSFPQRPTGPFDRSASMNRPGCSKAIALARRWLDELVAGTVADLSGLARREKRTERSIRMMLSLAFLDPAIIKAAADGRLPRGHGVSRLVNLPMAFADQWATLGLVRPA